MTSKRIRSFIIISVETIKPQCFDLCIDVFNNLFIRELFKNKRSSRYAKICVQRSLSQIGDITNKT